MVPVGAFWGPLRALPPYRRGRNHGRSWLRRSVAGEGVAGASRGALSAVRDPVYEPRQAVGGRRAGLEGSDNRSHAAATRRMAAAVARRRRRSTS